MNSLFVTGGTGFVGSGMVDFFLDRGKKVVVLTRSDRSTTTGRPGLSLVTGDPTRPGKWQEKAASCDGIVNLAGASIFTRWTEKAKKNILESRVMTTRRLVEALAAPEAACKVLLSTSAVGYYGFRGDEKLDESTRPGQDFLAGVSQAWEEEALKARDSGVRVALMRFGIVLEAGGGALGQMLPIFKLGAGGKIGDGRQWFSWIHRTDLIRAAEFVLASPEAEGPFNFTAPRPVTNRELTKALGKALHRPTILGVPGFLVKGVMGEFGEILVKGQRVLPKKLESLGFSFQFPELALALRDILGA